MGFLKASGLYQGVMDSLEPEGRRRILQDVMDGATLDADNNVRYRLRIPGPDTDDDGGLSLHSADSRRVEGQSYAVCPEMTSGLAALRSAA